MSIQTRLALLLPAAILSLFVACARQPELVSAQSSLPFHAANSEPKAPVSPLADLVPGTILVVHLRSPLSSALSHTGEVFKAVLEEPILQRGQVVAPKGSEVTGTILQASPSDPDREAGYLRLALTAITIDRQPFPLQSSSVFIKGATYDREAPAPPVQLVGASSAQGSRVVSRPLRVVVREDAGVPADRLLRFHVFPPASYEPGGQ